MAIPQESVNVQLDKNGKLPEEGLEAIKRDIASLCRDARGPHNNLQGRDKDDCHQISAITELQEELDGKSSTSHAATHLPDGSDPVSLSGLTKWNTATGAVSAAKNNGYFADASSAPVPITMPGSPSVGDRVAVVVINATNPVTIVRNGSKLLGGTDDLTLAADGDGVDLVYSGSAYGWTPANELRSIGGIVDGGNIADSYVGSSYSFDGGIF